MIYASPNVFLIVYFPPHFCFSLRLAAAVRDAVHLYTQPKRKKKRRRDVFAFASYKFMGCASLFETVLGCCRGASETLQRVENLPVCVRVCVCVCAQ